MNELKKVRTYADLPLELKSYKELLDRDINKMPSDKIKDILFEICSKTNNTEAYNNIN